MDADGAGTGLAALAVNRALVGYPYSAKDVIGLGSRSDAGLPLLGGI